jgi:Tfp pilus assembly PilM family ATPase
LERAGVDWRIAARWELADGLAEPSATAPEADGETMRLAQASSGDPGAWIAARRAEFRRARGLMRGKSSAICLTGPSIVLRNLQIPEGSDEERAHMIRQELAGDDEGEASAYEAASWSLDESPAAGRQLDLVTVAVRGELADRVAEGLFRCGYHPRALDVAPYAMARAVRLCDPFGDEPTIGLKIDDDSALFALIQNGRPGFCRTLRGCGLRGLAEPLVAKLGLSFGESKQVLRRHGVPTEAVAGTPSVNSFFRLLANPLEKLIDEVKRTCTFLHQAKRGRLPDRIWLFGDGAAVRNLPAYLTNRLAIPTVGWSPAFPAAGDVDDVRFGVAAGLSALGWEV